MPNPDLSGFLVFEIRPVFCLPSLPGGAPLNIFELASSDLMFDRLYTEIEAGEALGIKPRSLRTERLAGRIG